MADKITTSEIRQLIADCVRRRSDLSYKALAEKLGCSPRTIASIAKEFGIVRRAPLGIDHLRRMEEL
jgi:ribosome-binding protein aMBF1 (putative translation factor)